ncbi:RIP metalloprotease RseP [Mucilaginibacter sp. ZT4R22]|uniref:Zinc metalloprotease n=1 Tax=Mucilaginibacter pankratovii TaxID=2772110 RepID=A0ABR7WKE1_9SPHI|nr:RIP metalloprotease RseP [Mucilaginibacter pankratovii]MBD1362568.1 RIP metalloprotease RseP [Mucilaginibacter pankratovii]
MQILIITGQFLLSISLLVLMHELGHYIAAKAFGIRVKKFYLFFDAWGLSLLKFSYKGTIYGIGWLPLGGYIKMAGVFEDADSDAGITSVYDSGTFYSKPAWQRIIVMLGGIIMNIIVAIIIFSSLSIKYGDNYMQKLKAYFGVIPADIGQKAGLLPDDKIVAINEDSLYYQDELTSTRILRGNTLLTVIRSKGSERIHLHLNVSPKIMGLLADKAPTEFFSIGTPFKIDSIYSNSNLKAAGFSKSDQITAVNGNPVNYYEEFMVKLHENKDKPMLLTIVHEGKTSQVEAHRDKDGHFGFSLEAIHTPKAKPAQVTLPQSVSFGAGRTWSAFSDNARGIKDIVQGKVKATDALTGPVGIAVLFGKAPDWKTLWGLIAVLSTALAFINLMPIPVLDGGQVMFLVIEAVRGKPLKPVIIAYGQMAGFIILGLLTFFVLYTDIAKLIVK